MRVFIKCRRIGFPQHRIHKLQNNNRFFNLNINIEKIWYSKNLLSTILLPVSWLFQITVVVRRIYYRLRLPNAGASKIFTIVIGNITVGGTGKTPFVIWLAQMCKDQGLRVGIVSRGYKRNNEQRIVEVHPHSIPGEVGDEALLLALKTACPVVVAANRSQAVDRLVSKYDINVVLSDDGLQHYNLPRSVEIAVIDGERQLGNGRCLPAGPLREPAVRLDSCDLVVYNSGKGSYQYFFEADHGNLVSLSSDTACKPLSDFKNLIVHAVAGIGNPTRFFRTLQNAGLRIIEHRFPDHHAYQETDLDFNGNDPILMTEKDAVKCKRFKDKNIWYLPISLLPNSVLEKRISTLIGGIPRG